MSRKRTACVYTSAQAQRGVSQTEIGPPQCRFRTLIALTGTVARERVPCQRQRCARERPTPPVRRVPDSLPGRGLRDVPRDAPCGPRCAEKNIHNSNLAVARTSEMSEIRPTCPKLAPHAEIRVACPRFALQRHRVMTNLPTHFFSLPNTFLFWNPHRDIIYILYILLFNTSPVFRPA